MYDLCGENGCNFGTQLLYWVKKLQIFRNHTASKREVLPHDERLL